MDDAKALEIREIFRDVIPGFGVNHAKVYYCLLSSEPKSGKQIINETGICKSIAYSALKELVNAGVICRNNCRPTIFFTKDPMETYENIARQKSMELEKGLRKLGKIIEDDSQNENERILVVIGKGKQTKLINYRTMEEICRRDEAYRIKEFVNRAVDKIVAESLLKG